PPPKFFHTAQRKIPIKSPPAAPPPVATIIASIFISSASLYQSGETTERDRHQSGCKKDCGKASERFRNIVVFDLFADTRHYDNGEGKSRRSGKTVYRALKNIVIILHIDQGDTQYGAVGGDKGKIHAQRLIR